MHKSKFLDLSGQKIGRLTVIERYFSKKRDIYFRCKCDCGNVTLAMSGNLKSQRTRSCGCLEKEARITHNKANTDEYHAWENMKARCSKKKYLKHYINRGITICDEWKNSFENFYRDMGNRPSKKHSLDRIDNSKGYSKENCRWATRKEQQNNIRSNRIFEFDGMKMNISDWSKYLGGGTQLVITRLNNGWSLERALSTKCDTKCRSRHEK